MSRSSWPDAADRERQLSGCWERNEGRQIRTEDVPAPRARRAIGENDRLGRRSRRRQDNESGDPRMNNCMSPLPKCQLVRHIVVGLSALVLLGVGLQMPVSAADHDPGALVGTWRLVRYIDTPENGTSIQAFGTAPAGLSIFTAGGNVSISIMRNPPEIASATIDPDPDACVPGWYCSYFGTYTVDYRRGTWITHVVGGNIPAYLGTDQPRSFTIVHDTLTISETYMQGTQRVHAERVLVRSAQNP